MAGFEMVTAGLGGQYGCSKEFRLVTEQTDTHTLSIATESSISSWLFLSSFEIVLYPVEGRE